MANLIKKFKQIDLFGQPVSLNYRGQSSYQTKLGALVSSVFMVFVAYVTCIRLDKLIMRKNPQLTQYVKWLD